MTLLGTDIHTGQAIALAQRDRLQGAYLVGASGTGKTTLILNLLLADIRAGHGIALIEPHNDLTLHVLANIPLHRLADVIYVDLTDSAYPVGLNLFQCDSPHNATEVAKVASFVMHVFEKTWGVGTATPQLAQVLRNVTRTLIENQSMTFSEIPLLLWGDETVREKLTANLKNTHSQLFWQQYNRRSVRDRDELISSTMNKVDAYLNEPMIANILSQSKTTLDFRTIMDESKILLIRMSPQLEEMSRLVGSMLIGKLLMASYSRSDTPEQLRKPFFLYVDEFQKFCSEDVAVLIAESRKFRVAIGALANQTLGQLDEACRAAALQAGTMVAFRVSGSDGAVLAKSYDHTPTKEQVGVEPIRGPTPDPLGHLVRHGHQDPRVATFAQRYLGNLEHWLKTPWEQYPKPLWYAAHDCYFGGLQLTQEEVVEGRARLSECLFHCMRDRNPNVRIPALPLYVLAASQRDDREYAFAPFMQSVSQGFMAPHRLKRFEDRAYAFGEAAFLKPEAVQKFLTSKKQRWKAAATLLVEMLRELRYVLEKLSAEPILTDTGQFSIKYQTRTYNDVEAEVANMLVNQPNFQARVKTLAGEYIIKTTPAPQGLSGRALAVRISAIKERMSAQGVVRQAREVEKEVRERHDQLRSPTPAGRRSGGPPRTSESPPTHT